jgi:16S rRNA (uracil1498-N3)-methyltransferase
MTRRRWIADEVNGNKAILTGDHAAHLARVLRAQVGQEFEIATGDAVRSARITAISGDRVEFDLGAELKSKQPTSLTLILSIFKFDRMEWAIEKCTEIGIARIVPLIARRTDSHLAAAAPKRRERWERIARQASEQARRSAVPEIASPAKLKELIAASVTSQSSSTAAAPASKIVLAESGAEMPLHRIIATGSHKTNSEVMLAIGPEGGWTDDERDLFRQSGWVAASLGETILRVETAAVVATALALDALR